MERERGFVAWEAAVARGAGARLLVASEMVYGAKCDSGFEFCDAV